jgi:Cd2+/Zn2+-exporting ATPase
MGAAGTDVAMETADIVLMGNDLRLVADAYQLSKASRRMILQNLILALGVICIVSPLAIIGVADLGPAVILHEGSTIVVVLNSLRLLRWSPRRS